MNETWAVSALLVGIIALNQMTLAQITYEVATGSDSAAIQEAVNRAYCVDSRRWVAPGCP